MREEAVALRTLGWPLRTIAAELGVAHSTVSIWVRGVPAEEQDPGEAAPARELPVWTSGHLRRCARCRLHLPLELFGRLRAGGRQSWCRRCFRAYHRARKPLARARAAERISIAQAYVLTHLRDHPCSDCGERDPIVLEFDHVGIKRANVADLVRIGALPAMIALELSACEVVCVNCHRRRSAARRAGSRGRASTSRGHRSRARNKAFILEHLQRTGCLDCGIRDPTVLDFDHRANKVLNVSALARRECSLARLEEEMAKCEVRCANCHRRRTAAEFGYYRHRAAHAA